MSTELSVDQSSFFSLPEIWEQDFLALEAFYPYLLRRRSANLISWDITQRSKFCLFFSFYRAGGGKEGSVV